MGFWGRLFGGEKLSWSTDGDRALVDQPRQRRQRKQQETPIELTPWSATRLAAIFRELETQPSGRAIGEAGAPGSA